MSTDAELDALRHSVDIVQYISQYIQLTKHGSEYRGLCVFHPDRNPSFSVSGSKQVWACWSCCEHETHGADIFGFIRSFHGCSFPDAVLRLQNGNGAGTAKPIIRPALKKPPPRRTFPHPDGELPDMVHRDLGEPVKVWTIKTAEGAPYFYEARFIVDGHKETRFYTWGNYSDSDPPRWECKHPSNPRPFYGLDELARRPAAQVMVHEAPKKAEAGQALFPKLVHLGIVGGVYQVAHMDLTPLAGRRCILLPDNDEAGKQAMSRLAPLLWAAGAAEVKGVDPETLPDGSLAPDGWDIADTTDWTPAIALEWAKARKMDYPAPEPGKGGTDDAVSTATERSRSPADAVTGGAHPPNALGTPPMVEEPTEPKASDPAAKAQPAAAAQAVAPPPVFPPKTWDGLALILGAKGEVKACEHNAKELMAAAKQYDCLHFDSFLYRVRIGTRDWSDADDRDAVCWLQSAHQVAGFTLNQTRTAAMALAHARPHDSLFEFVMGLPEWDGIPRIEQAFTSAWGAPDDILTQAASRNFFIALHARAVKPGAQVDNLWAIEGPQGRLKSASLRALGEHFHAEISSPVGTNDFLRELQGVWIAELSELDSLRGREASTVKRLLSAPSDRFVQKYEKHASAYPRRAVAVATTNEATYWQDSTGARRLIPVRVGEIRLEVIREQRLQWFAEARHLHQAGAHWWEFPDGVAQAQESRQAVDPWEDTLRGYIDNGRMDADGYAKPWPDGWIASAEIMSDWLKLPASQQGKSSGVRLGHIMRRLGFRPRRSTTGNERGWAPKRFEGDEPG